MTVSTETEEEIATFVKKYCIALTGGIASGKSTIARMLSARGFIVFDADRCAHAVVEPGTKGLEQIRLAFGDDLVQENGMLNRSRMRELIAQDPEARTRLNSIMHPLIRDEFYREVQASSVWQHPGTFFYEAALIHETGRGEDFAATWCAFCSPEQQIERLIKRSAGALSRPHAEAMLRAQMPIDEKARRSTEIIDTSTSIEDVDRQLDRLLRH